MAKKSKAEKKAEKAAEQARLEAERLEAERVEAERLEAERIERERQERIRKELERVRKTKEAETLVAQSEALGAADRDREFLLQKEYRAAHDKKEWDNFLDCSDLPDVRYESEINTYTTMWEAEEDTSLDDAATMCEKAAQICSQLRALISTCEETGDTAPIPRLHANIAMLRRLTGKKLDYISAYLCQHAEEYAAERGTNVNLRSRTESIDYGLWVNLARQPRTKEVKYDDIDVTIEIPRALALANVALRVQHFAYDELAERPGGSPYLALGGPFAVELLALPPAPKDVKAWTLRQVTGLATDVLRLPYPIPPGGGEVFEPGTIPPMNDAAIANAPPLKVTLPEPKGVLIRGNLRVGWWDAGSESWKEEGISEIERQEEEGTISFKTVRLTTMAFLQPRGFDFPFRSWSLSPNGDNSALFTVTTPTREVGIEVGEGVCSLVSPDDAALKHLVGQQMEPLQFLHALATAGLNLVPEESDFEAFDELLPKQSYFEEAVYAELGLASAAVSLKCSKWNQTQKGFLAKDAGGNYTQTEDVASIRAVVQMCEDPSGNSEGAESEAGPDSRWKCVLFAPQRDRAPEIAPPDAALEMAEEELDAVPEPAEGEEPVEGEAAAEPAAEDGAEPAPTPEELAAAAEGEEINAADAPEEGEEVVTLLDQLPEDRTKVCALLSTLEDDAAFTEETYDDEGDVKEKVRCPIHTARDPRRCLAVMSLLLWLTRARGRSQFHCSVRDLLSKGEEDGEETAISRSAPRFTEASRHLMRTLRVLSMN